MNPLECIEEGIREGNWETVCEGYKGLTGKAIPLLEVGARQTVVVTEAVDLLRRFSYDIDEYFKLEIVPTKPTSTPIPKPPPPPPNETTTMGDAPPKKKPGRPKGSKKKKTADEEDSSIQLNMEDRTPGRNNDNQDIQTQMVQQKVDRTHLITNNPDPKEIEENKEKAEKANRNKVQLKRKPAKIFKVECNDCEKQFDSNRPQGELGQKCKKCLNTTRR